MTGPVLVTGATGKVGRRLVSHLSSLGVAARAASRAGAGPSGVIFDWSRPDTYEAALAGASAAYVVAPTGVGDPAPLLIGFAEAAQRLGVGRMVLQSASLLPAGGPGMGQLHRWMIDYAPDWAVLRPSWFMQNFSEAQHLATIRDEGAIYSATGAGRVPFIDADDIAASAAAALMRPEVANRDFVLTGPRAITYGEAAEEIGRVAGRPVRHVVLTPEALVERHMAGGMPFVHAQTLAFMDQAIAAGAEDRVTEEVETFTARPARDFATFARVNAEVWR